MRLMVDQVHINRVAVDIPAEVLAIICSHLDRLSIKSVRLVCQTFNFAASPYLFTRAHTSVHPFDHDVLVKISEHPVFSKSVRELVSHVRRLDVGMTNRPIYVSEMQDHFDINFDPSDRISRIDLTQAVVAEGFERYCELYRQQQQSMETEAQRKCLCTILPRMPNIQTLSFAYTWGPFTSFRPGYQPDGENEPASPLARLWHPQHARPRLTRIFPDPSTPGGQIKTELPVMIKALSQCGLYTTIKSLDIGKDSHHEICNDGLDKYLPLDGASSVFKSLTSIYISAQEHRFSEDVHAEGSPLAQLLNTTKSLKYLALEFWGNSYTIDNVALPSLKRLIGSQTLRELEFFSLHLMVEAEEMLDFLHRHRASLRHLRLNQMFSPLTRAGWAGFVDAVKGLGLGLTDFEIHLRWGDADANRAGALYSPLLYISSARLMTFLKGDGPNPLGSLMLDFTS